MVSGGGSVAQPTTSPVVPLLQVLPRGARAGGGASRAHAGTLSKLARDDDNATSENRIKSLKASRCLKGQGLFQVESYFITCS